MPQPASTDQERAFQCLKLYAAYVFTRAIQMIGFVTCAELGRSRNEDGSPFYRSCYVMVGPLAPLILSCGFICWQLFSNRTEYLRMCTNLTTLFTVLLILATAPAILLLFWTEILGPFNVMLKHTIIGLIASNVVLGCFGMIVQAKLTQDFKLSTSSRRNSVNVVARTTFATNQQYGVRFSKKPFPSR